mmetsp:Transcript_96604/g.273108  ORF Transcript_96604/g.273108 Transcript_96604/m.273108 type:complete len:290 (+) Transcript_96604:168-1037(+)
MPIRLVSLGEEEQSRARHVKAMHRAMAAIEVSDEWPSVRRQHRPQVQREAASPSGSNQLLCIDLPTSRLVENEPVGKVQHQPRRLVRIIVSSCLLRAHGRPKTSDHVRVGGCRCVANARLVHPGRQGRWRCCRAVEVGASTASKGRRTLFFLVEGATQAYHELTLHSLVHRRIPQLHTRERPDQSADALRCEVCQLRNGFAREAPQQRTVLYGEHCARPRQVCQTLGRKFGQPRAGGMNDVAHNRMLFDAKRGEGPCNVGEVLRLQSIQLGADFAHYRLEESAVTLANT